MGAYNDMIRTMLDDNNGFITASQVTDIGIPRRVLSEMSASGAVYRVERGIYAMPDVFEDEMFFLQYRYAKGIFSHGTALYLHSMTDRTPHIYSMTFPYGYNTSGAIRQNIAARVVALKFYELGATEIASPCGNPLRVYDVERTLCDIVKGKNALDVQLIGEAMKIYAASKTKNIEKLMNYAGQLRVQLKIQRYMEVLL